MAPALAFKRNRNWIRPATTISCESAGGEVSAMGWAWEKLEEHVEDDVEINAV